MQIPGLKTLAWPVLIAGQLSCSTAAIAERADPADWLNRMGAAVQLSSYEGTVIRIQDGKTEALRVVHTIKDGVIHEKVVAQEGDGLEIIRIGNEVHCILPNRKSVLVEEWDDQSTLFSTLPSSEIRFGSEYDVSLVREDRVAGREALLVAIRPHDVYRYGHRIWLDTETAFPLKTQLIDTDGAAIEQIKFADIRLNEDIHANALAPSYSTENFRWLKQTSHASSDEIETAWTSSNIPRGFRVVSTHGEVLPGSTGNVIHILYSDGLASISVFIAPQDGQYRDGPSSVGGSNSYSTTVDGHRVTAVGEVPGITVEQIATTMHRP